MSKDAPKGRQIWLTGQDAELARDALDHWCARLTMAYSETPPMSHKVAAQYVERRAVALRERFQAIVDACS